MQGKELNNIRLFPVDKIYQVDDSLDIGEPQPPFPDIHPLLYLVEQEEPKSNFELFQELRNSQDTFFNGRGGLRGNTIDELNNPTEELAQQLGEKLAEHIVKAQELLTRLGIKGGEV